MYILESTPVSYSIAPGRAIKYKQESRYQIPDKRSKNPERDSTKRVDGKQKVISKTKTRHIINHRGGQEIPPDQQNTGALLLHQRERKNILGCLGLLNT
jgi:hypothetical protein